MDALKHHVKLLKVIDEAMKSGSHIAGSAYSIADIAATPYIWRLEQLRLARIWDHRPGVAAWFERMQQRPSFDQAINKVVTQEGFDMYRNFQPDPWPRVQEILTALQGQLRLRSNGVATAVEPICDFGHSSRGQKPGQSAAMTCRLQ